MSRLHEGVFDAIVEVTGKDRQSLAPEKELVADLGVDSAKALQLLIEIEERLGIEISDEAAENLDTVADLLAYVDTFPAS